MTTGYLHPGYAQSLAEFGTPRHLPRSGGWILERPIPGSPYRDAMGCYPLFACRDWQHLSADLETLATETDLICLSLVADPFGNFDKLFLEKVFGNVIIPYKNHFITALTRPVNKIVSKHHRYYARKSLADVSVEVCPATEDFLDNWVLLYNTLIDRHQLTGIKAFSRDAFIRQLKTPGIVVFYARHHDTIVGAHLWYVQEKVAYSHLAASNDLGYELMASYALYWSAIEYFADKVTWLNLGAGAGLNSQADDGLTRFKRGWATGTRTAYFCGKIFDHAKYAEIVQMKNIPSTNYFPAYRQGEF